MTQQTLFGTESRTDGYSKQRKKIIKEHLEKVDEHNKQVSFTNLDNADKKVVITVEYGLDSNDERDFNVSDDTNGILGGAGSCGWNGSLEEKEEECIEWWKGHLLDDGYKRENISIVRKEMTEEDIKRHYQREMERLQYHLNNYDFKELSRLKAKLSDKEKDIADKKQKIEKYKEMVR